MSHSASSRQLELAQDIAAHEVREIVQWLDGQPYEDIWMLIRMVIAIY